MKEQIQQAIEDIDSIFNKGYARTHPQLIAGILIANATNNATNRMFEGQMGDYIDSATKLAKNINEEISSERLPTGETIFVSIWSTEGGKIPKSKYDSIVEVLDSILKSCNYGSYNPEKDAFEILNEKQEDIIIAMIDELEVNNMHEGITIKRTT